MKKLIIYSSLHHGNTEKIAKTMSEAIKADVARADEVDPNILGDYGIIGFGSGIYYGNPHKDIIDLIEKLPAYPGKNAFVFSTSGRGKAEYNLKITKKLSEKCFNVVGSFACKGYDTFGPFKLIGGISRGKPDNKDMLRARNFVLHLIEYA